MEAGLHPMGVPFSIHASFLEGPGKDFPSSVKYLEGYGNPSFRSVIKKGPKMFKRGNKFIFKAEKKSRNPLVL